MDIGKINDNYDFYKGYEGEPEIIITVNNASLHIWEGYLEDIYGNPPLDGAGWIGFTRDIHQIEGIFANEESSLKIDAEEYLKDLLLYQNAEFRYDETSDVYKLIKNWLTYAVNSNCVVIAEYIG